MSLAKGRIRGAAGAVAVGLALVGGLGGCAAYRSRPLATAPDLSASASGLKVDVARLRLSPLKPVVIDRADGLDPLELAVLAVLNSPDLEAKRAARGVRSAQVFAAGLLPDPQFTAGVDKPVAGPDHQTAYNLSASLDLAGLLARSSLRRAARSTATQADLDLLWAEWGVAQQARQLAETVLADERRAAWLRKVVAVASDRYEQSSRALERHDLPAQTTAADLAAKLDAQGQLAIAEHDAAKARRDLNALLGLEASVTVPIRPGPQPRGYDDGAVTAALSSLARRRPDLLALQAGYEAQNAGLRRAILAQFPLTQIGLALARDPAGVVTQGISTSFILPILNGGRGEVRVQNATREQLHAEYQARLDQTDADARNAQAELAGATRMAQSLRADVPRLQAMAANAPAAYARRDIDSQSYLALTQAVLSRQADLDDRELAARLAEIQLETALFLPPSEMRIQ